MLTDDHQNDGNYWFLKVTHRLSKTRCKGTQMGPKRDLGGGGTVGWGLAGNRMGVLESYNKRDPLKKRGSAPQNLDMWGKLWG